MADAKISSLTALTSAASDDVLPIVDTSATETKKITFANLTSSFLTSETDPLFNSVSGAINSHIASTSNPHSVDETDILPSQTGNGGLYLMTDGTNSSWAVVTSGSGSGDVTKVGTPADNQVGVWTGNGTIEGTSGLTYDGTVLHTAAYLELSGNTSTHVYAATSGSNHYVGASGGKIGFNGNMWLVDSSAGIKLADRFSNSQIVFEEAKPPYFKDSGIRLFKRDVTASGAITTTSDVIVVVNTTSGAVTVTLPNAPTALAGRPYIIKDKGNAGTNNVTIATTSSQTIDGAASATISSNYGVLRVFSDGTNWLTF